MLASTRASALLLLPTAGLLGACSDPVAAPTNVVSAAPTVRVVRTLSGEAARQQLLQDLAFLAEDSRARLVAPIVTTSGMMTPAELLRAETGGGRRPNLSIARNASQLGPSLSVSSAGCSLADSASFYGSSLPSPTGLTVVPLSPGATVGQTAFVTTRISARTSHTFPNGCVAVWQGTEYTVSLSGSELFKNTFTPQGYTSSFMSGPQEVSASEEITHQDCRISIVASTAHSAHWVSDVYGLREDRSLDPLPRRAYSVHSGANGACEGEEQTTGEQATGTGGGGTVVENGTGGYVLRICTTYLWYSASGEYLGKSSGGCIEKTVPIPVI